MKLVEGEVSVLSLEGKIVFENSNTIKHEAKDLIDEYQVERLVVDLKEVPFLDSSGVGVLISLFKTMNMKRGKMVLANLNRKVKRVIELTKLAEIIPVYSSVDEAREDLIEKGH